MNPVRFMQRKDAMKNPFTRVKSFTLSSLAVAMGVGVMSTIASTQGTAVRTTQVTQPPSIEIAALRDRVAALDRQVADLKEKVEELERKGLDAFKGFDSDSGEARLKTLEQRLGSVEKAQAIDRAVGGNGGTSDTDEPMTVQAPFVVRHGNRVIFRVDVPEDTGQGRLVIGNPVGARVVLGMTKDETPNVVLYTRDNRFRGAMMGDVETPQIVLGSSAGTATLMMQKTGGVLQFSNNTNPIVTLGLSEGGNGRLQIADAAGTTMVEAGTSATGFGIVRTGPQFGGPVGSLTIPWHIQGRKAR